MAIAADRVAELTVIDASGQEHNGSGYRVSSEIVLTAAHVIRDAKQITVDFGLDPAKQWSCKGSLLWPLEGTDLAFVRLDESISDGDGSPEFGRTPTNRNDKVPCEIVGFPLFKVHENPT